LFDAGVKHVHEVSVPVVSVGNITTGGSGKTPIAAWLANWFTSLGKRPAIVSRGYRSLDEGGNDEYRVLEQLCPGVPHELDRDRVAAARRAIESHLPDVLILDDGFQHRRLARDLDVVLVDALNPWGYGRLLPRGLLREPKSALGRADLVTITRVDRCDDATLSRLRSEIAAETTAPVAEVAFPPLRLQSFDGRMADLASLNGKKLLAFCGIGNPDGFRGTLSACGYSEEIVWLEAFPDHHHYTADDLRRLQSLADSKGAEAIVATQKDLVKLDPAWFDQRPVWAIVIGAEFRAGQDELTNLLGRLFDETSGAAPG
jgi:tetraacyldisaccharide 4'-kinase